MYAMSYIIELTDEHNNTEKIPRPDYGQLLALLLKYYYIM